MEQEQCPAEPLCYKSMCLAYCIVSHTTVFDKLINTPGNQVVVHLWSCRTLWAMQSCMRQDNFHGTGTLYRLRLWPKMCWTTSQSRCTQALSTLKLKSSGPADRFGSSFHSHQSALTVLYAWCQRMNLPPEFHLSCYSRRFQV